MKTKILVFIVMLITTGCEKVVYITGPTVTKVDTLVVNPQNGQTVNLMIDWSKFTQSSIFSGENMGNLTTSGVQITQVGSRLVYIKENASFTQVANKTSETQPQLITLQVPPTDSANLFIVATGCEPVSCSHRVAVKLGVRRNIKILPNSTINLTLDSLGLIDAVWTIDTTETNYSVSNDTIFTSRPVSNNNEIYNSLKVRISDPYQISPNVPLAQTMFISFIGTGRYRGNPLGMRLVEIDLNSTLTKFWPMINGNMFGLSYNPMIGKQGVVVTNFVNP